MKSPVPPDDSGLFLGSKDLSLAGQGDILARLVELAVRSSANDAGVLVFGRLPLTAIPAGWSHVDISRIADLFPPSGEFFQVLEDPFRSPIDAFAPSSVEYHRVAAVPVSGRGDFALYVFGARRMPFSDEEKQSLRDCARLAGENLVVEGGPTHGPVWDFDSDTQRYKELFENVTDIVFTQNTYGHITAVNATACRLTGFSRDDLLDRPLSDWVAPEQSETIRQILLEQFGGGSSQTYSLRLKKSDGSFLETEATVHLLFEKGRPIGLMGFARDVTHQQKERRARERAESALDQMDRRLEQLRSYLSLLSRLDRTSHDSFQELAADCLQTGCSALNADAGYLFEHKAGVVQLGLMHPVAAFPDRSGLAQLNLLELAKVLTEARSADVSKLTGETADHFLISAAVHVAGRPWGLLCFVSRPGAPRPTSEDEGFLHLLSSRLGRRLAHDELSLAHSDPLTGLLNGPGLMRRIDSHIQSAGHGGGQFAVLIIDVDLLALYNQQFGFEAGDELLRNLGRRFQQVATAGEVIGRMEADRFVVLVPATSEPRDVREDAARFLRIARDPIAVSGQQHPVTVSIGIAQFPEHAASALGLLRCAGQALNEVKARGRDGAAVYSTRIESSGMERMQIDAGLRSALSNHEFSLLYQPQVSVAGSLTGFEVLLAWRHPERGLIPAAQFIPRAEITGLIIPIGAWVLEQACRQMSTWRRCGLPSVKVAVNVSALQFERQDFVDLVSKALREHHVKPRSLELEVTESTLMRDVAQSARVMRQLRDLDVQLAIDDFGTGYSSLSYLNQLPVHTLKIDRSFLQDEYPPDSIFATVKAIVDLAHSLGLSVVGEGVEKLSQLRLLEKAGCDTIQGYLIGRPLGSDAASRMLAQRQASEDK